MTTWGHPTTCSRRQGQTATCIRLTPLGTIWLVKHISHLRYVGDKKATHPPTNRLTCQRLDHWPLTRSQRRDRNRFGSILYTRKRPGSAVTSLVPRWFLTLIWVVIPSNFFVTVWIRNLSSFVLLFLWNSLEHYYFHRYPRYHWSHGHKNHQWYQPGPTRATDGSAR